MKEKTTIQIYFNNFISLLLLFIYKIILPNPKKGNSLLLINTGQIGDLIISSVILRNSKYILNNYDNIYFIAKEEYSILIENFKNIKVISWNRKNFNLNPVYRYKFLTVIRNLGINTSINLTAARGVSSDTLALLSGGKKIIAINNNYRYLKKLFGKYLDNLYTEIICKEIANEYMKNIEVLRYLNINSYVSSTFLPINKHNVFFILRKIGMKNDLAKKIVIAPFSDLPIKDWGLINYKYIITEILNKFEDVKIVLFGSEEQREKIKELVPINTDRVYNIAGILNINESAILLSSCDLFIGNDSGFTHIAKALGVNMIGIIGGGSYGFFFPYNVGSNEIYLFNKLDCFGCEWRCIYSKPFCLTGVSYDEVLEKVTEFLNENS